MKFKFAFFIARTLLNGMLFFFIICGSSGTRGSVAPAPVALLLIRHWSTRLQSIVKRRRRRSYVEHRGSCAMDSPRWTRSQQKRSWTEMEITVPSTVFTLPANTPMDHTQRLLAPRVVSSVQSQKNDFCSTATLPPSPKRWCTTRKKRHHCQSFFSNLYEFCIMLFDAHFNSRRIT